MRVLGVLLVSVMALSLAACGGDDEPRRTTTTTSTPSVVPAAEWRTQLDLACAEWNERYHHLADAEPSSKQEAIEHSQDVRELADGLAGAVAEAGLPDAGRDDAERLVDLSQLIADAASDLAAAAQSADAIAVDGAAERISTLGDELNPLAEELGVPACGGY